VRSSNQEWAIQRNWQQWVHKAHDKDEHNKTHTQKKTAGRCDTIEILMNVVFNIQISNLILMNKMLQVLLIMLFTFFFSLLIKKYRAKCDDILFISILSKSFFYLNDKNKMKNVVMHIFSTCE
jgi:hypothetical protein